MTELLVDNLGRLIAMAVLLMLSAFFSGSETALFSLSRDRLRRFRHSTSFLETFVPRLTDHPRALLVTILFGNMVVNVTFFALSGNLVSDVARQWGHVPSVAVGVGVLLAVILCGEVAPKTLASARPVPIARCSGLPLYGLRWILTPLGWFLDRLVVEPLSRLITGRRADDRGIYVTTDELQAIVELASDEAVVARDEGDMISQVLQLHDTLVAEVMVPRVDIVACDVSAPTDELLAMFRSTRKKKIVIYRETPDDVVGIVRAREAFFHPSLAITELVERVHFVPEQQTVERLLKVFREKKIQVAIVVDEYGGTAGLITLEDCIEEIVGNIADEYEAPGEPARRLSDNEFLLDGNLGVHAWSDYLQVDLDTEMGVATLGGFVTALLGHIPRPGDSCRYANLRFTVRDVVCRHRIAGRPCGRPAKILVEILPQSAASDAEGPACRTTPMAGGPRDD